MSRYIHLRSKKTNTKVLIQPISSVFGSFKQYLLAFSTFFIGQTQGYDINPPSCSSNNPPSGSSSGSQSTHNTGLQFIHLTTTIFQKSSSDFEEEQHKILTDNRKTFVWNLYTQQNICRAEDDFRFSTTFPE